MKNNKGFLLLEVILSIVIIAGGLLFVMRAYSTSKEMIERSRDIFKTSLLLENRIFEFDETDKIERDLAAKGEFANDKDYSWSLKTARVDESGLNIVMLDVFETKRPAGTKYSLMTYLKNKTK